MGIDNFDFLGRVKFNLHRKEVLQKIRIIKTMTILDLEEKQFILLQE